MMLILPIDEPAAAPAGGFFSSGFLAGARCGNCAHWRRAGPDAKLGQCAARPMVRPLRFDVMCVVDGGNAFCEVR